MTFVTFNVYCLPTKVSRAWYYLLLCGFRRHFLTRSRVYRLWIPGSIPMVLGPRGLGFAQLLHSFASHHGWCGIVLSPSDSRSTFQLDSLWFPWSDKFWIVFERLSSKNVSNTSQSTPLDFRESSDRGVLEAR